MEMNNNRKKRILIGSPIHQEPEILKAFLLSLYNLKQDSLELGYFFIDDNKDPESSKLLRDFAKEKGEVTLLLSGQHDEYVKNEKTHYWNDYLVWKVADFKNTIIKQAIYEEYDYLFLVDSDLVLHPQTVNQLAETEKDIISEVFWTSWQEGSIPQPQVWVRGEYHQWEKRMGEEDLSNEETAKRFYQFLEKMRVPGVYEVGGLGACTLISRKAMLAGVNFTEIKNLSFWGEDRHFCVRASVLGFSLFVDTHFPAYHIYRAADLMDVSQFREKSGYELHELPIHAEKPNEHQLTLSMIVKNEGNRYLRKMLEEQKRFIDGAVIIDDGSVDDTVNVCMKLMKGIPLKLVKNETSKFSNEVELRKQQWEETVKTKPGWVLCLDADEIFERSFAEYIDLLIQHQGIDLYCFRLYDMWDEQHYREDSLWYAHQIYRPFLFRYRHDFECKWKETAQHCGRLPENIFDLPHSLSIFRIKHYGWAREEDRMEKYARYRRLDPEGRIGILDQYESILDKHPNLIRWVE